MPQVDFYIAKTATEAQAWQLVCKIISKAYAAKKTVFVRCQNSEAASLLDDLLWQFDDISFIPHALLETDLEERPPILLGTGEQTEPANILFNLHNDLPDNLTDYDRIIEIVFADEERKKVARSHYKAYQALDFPLKSHNV